MSCMQLPSHVMKSATMPSSAVHLSRSYRPFWLTSNSYEFPNYVFLHPSLNKQVALILYYAHVMDQKKLLKDFFKLCKDSFENKYGSKGLESAVKTWIKHSIVKLQRRREQIISNAVTTVQTEMVRTISRILLSIFCDLIQESSDKVSSCSLNALSQKCESGAAVTNLYASSFYNESGLLLPRTSNTKDFSVWDQFFLGLPFQKNKNLAVSVPKNNPIDWLHKFWLTFCYQPDPTNSIYNEDTTTKATNFQCISQNYISRKMMVLDQSSVKCIIKTTHLNQSCIHLELTESNLKNHNKNYSKNDHVKSPPESSGDSSTNWSQEDSESSDSWSATDFADEMSEEVSFNSISMSPGTGHDPCNRTMRWLQADSDSDDGSVIFGDVITEENCLERGRSNGSLYFIDTDDDDDDVDVLFSESSTVSFPTDIYDDKSQGYDNPCFEEEFISSRVPKYISTVNECWSEMMLGIEDKPRQASKVSFAPESSLVTIHCFEKTEKNSFDSAAILDRMRFQHRIKELNHMLIPFFTCEHRKEIERRNCV